MVISIHRSIRSSVCSAVLIVVATLGLCAVGTCGDDVRFVLEWAPPTQPPLELLEMEAKCTAALKMLGEDDSESRAQVLYRRARIRTEVEKSKECREDLEQAILLSPNNLDLQHEYGLLLFYEPVRKDDQEKAQALATKMIAKSPRAYQGYLLRAECLGGNADYSSALLDLEEAIRLAPASVECRIRRATAYNNLGLLDKARKDIEAIRRLPPTFESYGGSIDLIDGVLHHRAGDYDAAIPFLLRGMLLKKRHHSDAQAVFYVALWYSYVMTGRHASAVSLADRLKVVRADNAETYAIGALMAADDGDLESALKMAKRAVALDPSGLFTVGTLGKVLMARGDFGAAAEMFTTALKGRHDVEADLTLRLALLKAAAPEPAIRDSQESKRLIELSSAFDAPSLEPIVLLIRACSEADRHDFNMAKVSVAQCLQSEGIDEELRSVAESMKERFGKSEPFRLNKTTPNFRLPCQHRLKGAAYAL